MVTIVKPWAYMNRSGEALVPLTRTDSFEAASQLLVLVDDVALPVGRFRIRGSGSPGGHNGLRSVEAAIGGRDYPRLRIGVGAKPPEWEDLADWVLSRFTKDEISILTELVPPMAQAVECWITEGIDAAMSRFNQL